jgi:hypothetical protein
MKPSDLKPQPIRFDITMNYERIVDPITGKARVNGRQESIRMQLLTMHEWHEIGYMIDDPAPPLDVKTGKPDYQSMRSITERSRAEYERNVLRLAHALAKGGDMKFDGSTLEEQAEELKETLDAGIFNAMFTELQNATNSFEIKVSTIAERFPSGNENGRVPESAVTDNVAASELVPSVG